MAVLKASKVIAMAIFLTVVLISSDFSTAYADPDTLPLVKIGRRTLMGENPNGRGGYNAEPNGRGGYNKYDPTGRGGYNAEPNGRGGYNKYDPTGRGGYN